MTQPIGAEHDFHDPVYARDWADRFVPNPHRECLFATILERLTFPGLPCAHLLELGVGPGYLAERLLRRLSGVSYEGIDFSEPMLQLAAQRLSRYGRRVSLKRADLLGDQWVERIRRPVGAIVSTWALHDLGGEDQIASVYRKAGELLPDDGVFLNGDFVKPDQTRFEYEPGRIPVARHLELLAESGFRQPRCLVFLERELERPTSADNYACLCAVR